MTGFYLRRWAIVLLSFIAGAAMAHPLLKLAALAIALAAVVQVLIVSWEEMK